MQGKLPTIQYLRGLAAMLVVASHALLYPLAEQTIAYGRLGWLGVILFFVVSGFIMVTVTGPGSFDPVAFLKRRILRIVPLYWAFTLVAAALALVEPGLFKTTVFDAGQLLKSLVFVPFYNPASHGLHPLYKLGWTLNYEMFFYVGFAVLALLTARRRVAVLTIAYVALALTGALRQPVDAIPAFYTSFMPLAFVAGAWLGLAQIEGYLRKVPAAVLVGLAIMALAGLVQGFTWDHGLVEDPVAFIGLLSFAAATVALVVGLEPVLPRVRFLETLGDASYSIYLVHIFAVAATAGVLLRLLDTTDPLVTNAIIAFAIVAGAVAGLMLYRLVERPLMGRLRKLA